MLSCCCSKSLLLSSVMVSPGNGCLTIIILLIGLAISFCTRREAIVDKDIGMGEDTPGDFKGGGGGLL